MRKQVVFVAQNGIRLVIDKNSDPRNVKLFNDVVVRQMKERH